MNIETDNNAQIQNGIDQARRDLVAPAQKLADAEERCAQCISEVTIEVTAAEIKD